MKILSNLKADALTKLKASTLTRLKVNALNNLKLKGFTLAPLKVKGFTLAEVLITLTIIGVVAALTIPSLLSNVNDKTYDAKRKGFSTRMAQALSQMDSLNSYEDKTDAAKNSSMNFVIDGLSKVYKITNVCEFENFAACDFPTNYGAWWTINKSQTRLLETIDFNGYEAEAVTFKTKNGESILLHYNPNCVDEQDPDINGVKNWKSEICLVIRYDLDGAKKGPNQIGKDMGYTIVLYPDTPYVITPSPIFNDKYLSRPSYSNSTAADATALSYCEAMDGVFGYPKGSWTLPSREELYALIIGYGSGGSQNAWTTSIEGSGPNDYGWQVTKDGTARRVTRDTNGYVVCILKKTKL